MKIPSVIKFGPKCNKGGICKSSLYNQTSNIPTTNYEVTCRNQPLPFFNVHGVHVTVKLNFTSSSNLARNVLAKQHWPLKNKAIATV